MSDIRAGIAEAVARSFRDLYTVDIPAAEAAVVPSTRADYQTDLALRWAPRLGRPAREVAEAVARAVVGDLVEPPSVAGPGFLNFTVRREWLGGAVARLAGDPRLGVPVAERPRRIALDYSGPNAAKEMHVGHLRSTVIGDALLRLLRFAGHDVTPHNHLGDWGTPFGMLIEHLVGSGWDGGPVDDVNAAYRRARERFDDDPAFADRARARVVLLQGGDEATTRLWRTLVEQSYAHLARVYDLLDVLLGEQDVRGESFYHPMLADTVAELEAAGLTRVDGGALCLFPPGFTNRDGRPLPVILRKADGGYGYHATDLAAVRHRTRERGATELLYVVGAPQALHFALLFAASREAGYLDAEHRAEHVAFGSVLDEDGRVVRTREGESVGLVDLLAEAVRQAGEVLSDRGFDGPEREELARVVGVGAVKYADLSTDRLKDYVFTWERMLARDGNTSVYLQYANARARSILRAADAEADVGAGGPVPLDDPAERELALRLAQFAGAVEDAVRDLAPHLLCRHLFTTAAAFTRFYERCPVLADEVAGPARAARLALTRLTSAALELGLSLIGVGAPDRM